MFGKTFQADQKRVSRKSRGRRIRRVAVGRRIQRQHLPQALMGGSHEIKKLVRCKPEIADTAARRQRDGVQQDAGKAGKGLGIW